MFYLRFPGLFAFFELAAPILGKNLATWTQSNQSFEEE